MEDLFIDARGQEHRRPSDQPISERTSVYGLWTENDRYLMVRPLWSDLYEFPGGAVEENESTQEALNREFTEETGRSTRDVDDAPVYIEQSNFYDFDTNRYFQSTCMFFCVKTVSEVSRGTDESIRCVEMVDVQSLDPRAVRPMHWRAYEFFLDRD